MELFLIRHGESTDNAHVDRGDRKVDGGLTGLGKQQSKLLAEHLATGSTIDWVGDPASINAEPHFRQGFGITSLFSSPRHRSLQTAVPVGHALGLSPQLWIDLGPLGGRGRTRSEISAEFPSVQFPPDMTEDGWWNQGYEGALISPEYAMRVSEQLCEMAGSEERVAIISHGSIMDLLMKALLGRPHDEQFRYRHVNTAISRLSFTPGSPIRVQSLNLVHHLPPELIS